MASKRKPPTKYMQPMTDRRIDDVAVFVEHLREHMANGSIGQVVSSLYNMTVLLAQLHGEYAERLGRHMECYERGQKRSK